jgi:hypothetical protein
MGQFTKANEGKVRSASVNGMTIEQFAEMVQEMVAAQTEEYGGELRSRQVKALAQIVSGLVFGLADQQREIFARLKKLEQEAGN